MSLTSPSERRATRGLRAFVIHLALSLGGFVVLIGAGQASVRLVLTAAIGAVTPVITLGAIRWYRPAHGWVWALVAGAEVLWAVVLMADPHATVRPWDLPVSVAEVLATIGYATTIGALAGLVRMSNAQRRTLSSIDTTVLTIAVCAIVWAVNRTLRGSAAPSLPPFASFAYPIADALIATFVVRIAARATITRPAYMLAVAGASMLLANDLALLLVPPRDSALATACLQYLALALLGLAALHPTMGSITEPTGGWLSETGRVRITVLGIALMTPPALLALCGSSVDRVTAAGLAAACAWSIALVLIRLAGIVRVVRHQGERLGGLARSDHLTGLPNRRTVDAELERSAMEAASSEQPLVVALVDLDHFKDFNDARGHAAGDRVLAGVGDAWRANLPADIFLGRYGGEEFLAVTRGRTCEQLADVIESLRGCTPAGQSFSVGLAEWDGLEDSVVLVGRADAALYQAKAAGRGCSWVAPVPGAMPRPHETHQPTPA